MNGAPEGDVSLIIFSENIRTKFFYNKKIKRKKYNQHISKAENFNSENKTKKKNGINYEVKL
jgi:hypothetical protein